MEDLLILVDENDAPYGKLEKLKVHQKGLLHRAFSVFIFNSNNELLLQQRALEKYHSAGLWTNTCCSHPRYGEEMTDAINRRLKEEMGIQCATHFAFSFVYKVEFDNGLTEHDFDHVYVGKSDDVPCIEPSEVKEFKYTSLLQLKKDVQQQPEKYTEWMKICLPKIENYILTF